MQVRLAALATVIATLTFVPAAHATLDTQVDAGVLTITQVQPGAATVVDHGADGIEVRSGESNTTGCTPACVGVTSIHYVGSDSDDRLDGSDAPVPIVADGGGGADQLTGGRFADTLSGGPADDVLSDGNAVPDVGDTFDGGPGIDTVAYGGSFRDGPRTGPLGITLAEAGVTSTGNGAPAEDDHIKDVENASSGGTDDTITGNTQDNVITSGQGVDSIHAGDGADTIDSRDEVSDSVDCGPGVDHLRSDLKLDVPSGCEQVEPQIFGLPKLVAAPVVGVPAAVDTASITALGDPAPTLSYRWAACGRYFCGGQQIGTGSTYTPTQADRSYMSYGIEADVTATNPYGSDTVRSDRQMVNDPPTPLSGGGSLPSTAGTTPAAPVPFDAPSLAKLALPGQILVPVPSLSSAGLFAFRPRGTLRLSKARGNVAYAVLVCGADARCAFTVQLVLRSGSRVIARLPGLKRSWKPGTARSLTVAPSAAVRAAIRRARHVRLVVTLTPSGSTKPLGVLSIPVSCGRAAASRGGGAIP